MIEKPFGYDLESAENLQHRGCSRHLREDQIYRIDHYLGKATVQNVLVFRFANLMLEPLWNRNYIDHVQITVPRSWRVSRAAPDYYDGTGALRDMLQSHLLQLLTLVAMEPPAILDAEILRDEKVKVLRSIRPITAERGPRPGLPRPVRAPARSTGQKVPGYLEETGVPRQQRHRDLCRAQALYRQLALAQRAVLPAHRQTHGQAQSMIAIRFKHPPQQLFRETQIEAAQTQLATAEYPAQRMHAPGNAGQATGLEMSTETTRLDASYCGLNNRAARRL